MQTEPSVSGSAGFSSGAGRLPCGEAVGPAVEGSSQASAVLRL